MQNWLKWLGFNDGADQSKTQCFKVRFLTLSIMSQWIGCAFSEAVACISGQGFNADIIFPKFEYEFEKPQLIRLFLSGF